MSDKDGLSDIEPQGLRVLVLGTSYQVIVTERQIKLQEEGRPGPLHTWKAGPTREVAFLQAMDLAVSLADGAPWWYAVSATGAEAWLLTSPSDLASQRLIQVHGHEVFRFFEGDLHLAYEIRGGLPYAGRVYRRAHLLAELEASQAEQVYRLTALMERPIIEVLPELGVEM